jgi:hypothetical protein
MDVTVGHSEQELGGDQGFGPACVIERRVSGWKRIKGLGMRAGGG